MTLRIRLKIEHSNVGNETDQITKKIEVLTRSAAECQYVSLLRNSKNRGG